MRKRISFEAKPSSSQADLDTPLSLKERWALIMSRSIVFKQQLTLSYFNNLRFEDRTLLEVLELQGWVSFLQRTDVVSMDLVRGSLAMRGL